MGKKFDFSKAIITVDTSEEAKKELESRIAYSKMAVEEKKALADEQQKQWNKEHGITN